MIRNRYKPPTSTSLNDSSSSEDEEDLLIQHELEQERLLSEEHGEANEAPANATTKKRQSDSEIANALNANNAEKRKKPRMTLTVKKLTGPTGLIAIRHDFEKVKYRKPKPVKAGKNKDKKLMQKKQFEREIQASASYLGKVMLAYQEFALDIAPNMHYNDTFIKIRELGSKGELKTYLNTMREDICRQQLDKEYGSVKAERYMNELENGLQASSGGNDYEDQYNDVGGTGVSRRLASLEAMDDDNEISSNSKSDSDLQTSQILKETDKSNSLANDSEKEDDEMEASFDDVVPTQATAGTGESENEALSDSDKSCEANDDSENEDLEEPRALEAGKETEDDLGDATSNLQEEESNDDDDLEEPRDSDAEGNLEEKVSDSSEKLNDDDLEEPRDLEAERNREEGAASLRQDSKDDDLEEPRDLEAEKKLEVQVADSQEKLKDDDGLEEPTDFGAEKKIEEQVSDSQEKLQDDDLEEPRDLEAERRKDEEEQVDDSQKEEKDVEPRALEGGNECENTKNRAVFPNESTDNEADKLKDLEDSKDEKETESNDLNDCEIREIPQTQDDSLVFDGNQSEEDMRMTQDTQFGATQDSLVLDSSQTWQSQEGATQETLVFDPSQTQESQGATQETLVFDPSQTQDSQGATQDTLVLDSSQDIEITHINHVGGSQDY